MLVVGLYRAVSTAELADIVVTGRYRLLPGGVEDKYFCLSLSDARYFRDQVILAATAIVHSFVLRATFDLLEQGVFDQRPGMFVNLITLPMVNSDVLRFGGIRRLE